MMTCPSHVCNNYMETTARCLRSVKKRSELKQTLAHLTWVYLPFRHSCTVTANGELTQHPGNAGPNRYQVQGSQESVLKTVCAHFLFWNPSKLTIMDTKPWILLAAQVFSIRAAVEKSAPMEANCLLKFLKESDEVMRDFPFHCAWLPNRCVKGLKACKH